MDVTGTLLYPSETRVRGCNGNVLLACITAVQAHEFVLGRFPNVQPAEVAAQIKKYGRIFGRFDGVRAEKLHAKILRIVSA